MYAGQTRKKQLFRLQIADNLWPENIVSTLRFLLLFLFEWFLNLIQSWWD